MRWVFLGVIAAFTIPKIMVTQQDQKYNAAAKDVAAMVAGAHTQLSLSGNLSMNTTMGDLTPYVNYIGTTNSGLIDYVYTGGSGSCGGINVCLMMHNGGIFKYAKDRKFNGTATTNGIPFYFDPDGVYSGTTNGPGKTIQMTLYYNSRILDIGNTLPNTQNSIDTYGATPGFVPPWFSW